MVKKKTIFLFLIIVISLITVSAVSAAEDNATDIVSVEENEEVILEENSNEDILNAENENNELSNGVGSFSDLNNAINGNNLTVVELTQDFIYNSSTDKSFQEGGVTINRDMTIKGNGHYIDGNGQARIFSTTHAVTFEDIHFKNAEGFDEGAINGNEDVTAINCNFTQNHGRYGGAMNKGTAIGCIFIENTAYYGPALMEGTAINCTFIKNHADYNGGAMKDGFAKNCTFIQNIAEYMGGALYNSIAMFCNFTDNDAYEGYDMYGGVIIKCSPRAKTMRTITDVPTINAPASISTIMDSGDVLKYTIVVAQREVPYADATIKIYSGNRSTLIKTIHDSRGEWVIDLPANDSPYIVDISADGFTADEVPVKTVMVYVNKISTQILLNVTSIDPGEAYVEPVLVDQWGNPIFFAQIQVFWRDHAEHQGEYITDPDGKIRVPTGFLTSDNDLLIMTYSGNEKYESYRFSKFITVRGASELIATNLSTIYGVEEYMNVTLVDSSNHRGIQNANVTVDIGGVKKQYVTDSSGKIRIPTKDVSAGNNTVEITFEATYDYMKSSIIRMLNVEPCNTTLSLEEVMVADGIWDLVITLKDQFGNPMNNATININSNSGLPFSWSGVTNETGQARAPVSEAPAGHYSLNIIFEQVPEHAYIPNYRGSYRWDYWITVNFLPSTLTLNDSEKRDFYYSEKASVEGVLLDHQGNPIINATVYVDIDGVKNYTTDENGIFKFIIEDIAPGHHDVNITFNGNGKYTKSNYTWDINVIATPTELHASNVTTTYNVNQDLVITLTDYYNNPLSGFIVSVDLDGVSNYTTDENGQIIIPTKNIAANNYTVVITFAGNGNYTESSTTAEVNISKDTTQLSSTDLITVYRYEDTFNITLTDSFGNPLGGCMVYVDMYGIRNYTTDENGMVAVPINGVAANNYTAAITFEGNENYTGSNTTSSVKILKGHSHVIGWYGVHDYVVDYDSEEYAKVLVEGYDIVEGDPYYYYGVIGNATLSVDFGRSAKNFITDESGILLIPLKGLNANFYNVLVSFAGNENFTGSNRTLKVTVNPIYSPMNVTINTTDNNVTFTVDNFHEKATGFVKFDITGPQDYVVYVDVVDGKAVLEDVLRAGDYTAVITYLGDNNFFASNMTKTFTVTGHVKKDTAISSVASVEDYTVTITTDVDANATGYVTIGILGQTFLVPVNNGNAVFNYDFTPGTYNANVTYWGDDNFNNASCEVSFTVTQKDVELKNTTISVDVESVENDVTITANIDPKASGLVEFNIAGKAVYVAVVNGKAVYTTNLPAGDYNVEATYLGDSKYNANRTSRDFTVTDHIKKNTTLVSDVVVDGYDVTVTVNVDESATGFVKFTVKGDNVFAEVVDGKAVMNMMLPAGNYTIAAVYLGDDDFNTNATDIAVKVEDIPLKDTPIDVSTVVNENNVTITVNVDPAATGLVKFNITGAENYVLYVEVVDGNAVLEDVLMAGDYNVKVTYMGDGIYNSNSTTDAFTIVGHIKKDTELTTVANVDGTTVSIVASVDENATGYVTISVLGQTFIVPVNNGKAEFSYDFVPGTYSANVAYLGDDNYNNASGTVSFTVTNQTAELKNTTIDVNVEVNKDSVTLTATVDSSASGLVEFNIGGQAVYLAVNNGKAVYNTILPIGNYSVDVTYLGDSKFNANKTTATFEVAENSSDKNVTPELLKTVIFAPSVTTTYNGNGYVTLTIKDENGQFVKSRSISISIAGKTKVVKTNANGVAKLSTNGIAPGKYNVIIVFNGDKTYAPSNAVPALVVKKAASKITAKKKTFKKAKKTKKYKITLKSGKKAIKKVQVTLKIKGKTYKAKTNAKGKAVFKIKKLSKKGKFKATIKFKGNKYYKATTKKVKITIK